MLTCDVLVLLKSPVDGPGADAVREAIYGATRSAVVTFEEARPKVFLVRFDPDHDTTAAILDAVRATGQAASIAGG